MTNRPEDRLRKLASTEAPPPHPQFAASLEQRLRDVHATAVVATDARKRRSATVFLRPALVLGAVLVLALGWVGFQREDDTEVLAVSFADQTSVRLPDGTEVDGVSGLELPDGSVISLEAGGTLVVNDIKYDEPSVFDVIDGKLQRRFPGIEERPQSIAERATTTVHNAITSPPPTNTDTGSSSAAAPQHTIPTPNAATTTIAVRSASSATSAPAIGVVPSATATSEPSRPSMTATPSTRPPTRPAVVDRPTPTTPPTTVDSAPPARQTTTSSSLATTTSVASPAPPVVELTATPARPGQWHLDWTVSRSDTPNNGIAGWVVRAATGSPAPEPDGDAARQVAVLRDPAARRLVITPPTDVRQVRYLVEARGADGAVIVTSKSVLIELRR